MQKILSKIAKVARILDLKKEKMLADKLDTALNSIAELTAKEKSQVGDYFPKEELIPEITPEQLARNKERQQKMNAMEKIRLDQKQNQELMGLVPKSLVAPSTNTSTVDVNTLAPMDTPIDVGLKSPSPTPNIKEMPRDVLPTTNMPNVPSPLARK